MSLGRSSGATLIGRPLDITVQASLEGADDNPLSCLEAEVFYADERIDRSRVRTSLERRATAQEVLIRIRVARPVDEPVVTLYLRAGCVQRTEKRYVLLADVVTEQAPIARSAVLAGPSSADAPAAPAAPVAAPAPARRLPEPSSAAVAATGRTLTRGTDATPVPRVRRAAAPVAAVRPAARLQLEPIDLSVETFPQLRPASELLSLPASNPGQREQAAALWQALSAQPEDVRAAAAKLAAIEAAVQGLQLETRKNQAALAELGAALQTARQERYANGLVYGLLLALGLALAGLGYFWRRRSGAGSTPRGDKPWWGDKLPDDTGWHSAMGPMVSGDALHGEDGNTSLRAEFGDQVARVPGEAAARAAGSRRFAPSRVPPLSRRDLTDFGLSMPYSPPRAAKAEELLDIQHQADFFVSIGQENRAIEILLDHVGDDLQSSALIYLDLFDLYHKLKRKDDYLALAELFNRTFNAKIPAFEAYAGRERDVRGLESYAAPLAHIRSAWPQAAVLGIMEAMIFRSPQGQGVSFEPEAFRELLMLYGVARDIVDAAAEAGSLADSPDFELPDSAAAADHNNAAALPEAAVRPTPVLPVTTLASVPALDIDLAALLGADAPTAAGELQAPVLVLPVGSAAAAPVFSELLDFDVLTLQPKQPASGKDSPMAG